MADRLSLRAAGRIVGCDHAYLARLVKNGRLARGLDKLVDLDDVRSLLSQADPAMKRKEVVTEGGDQVVTSHQSPLLDHQSSPSSAATPAPTISTEQQAREAVALIARVLEQEGIASAGPIDFPKARLAETILKARQRELAIAERRKELLPRGPLLEHVAKAFTGFKQTIQRMPSRHAPAMAAELECDPSRLHAALDRMIHATLEEMSAPVMRG